MMPKVLFNGFTHHAFPIVELAMHVTKEQVLSYSVNNGVFYFALRI